MVIWFIEMLGYGDGRDIASTTGASPVEGSILAEVIIRCHVNVMFVEGSWSIGP